MVCRAGGYRRRLVRGGGTSAGELVAVFAGGGGGRAVENFEVKDAALKGRRFYTNRR